MTTYKNTRSFYGDLTYNITGGFEHATFQIVQKKGERNYHHYYFNSGSGIDFTINQNTKHQFRTSSTGLVNPILEMISDKYKPLKKKNNSSMENIYEKDWKD